LSDDRREADRRARDRRAERRAVALTEQPPVAAPPTAAPADDPAFAAQLIGQTGQKRGLKAGPPVLDQARSTYLGAEYSGSNERRPKPGGAAKRDV
jgi:hypothetical protein